MVSNTMVFFLSMAPCQDCSIEIAVNARRANLSIFIFYPTPTGNSDGIIKAFSNPDVTGCIEGPFEYNLWYVDVDTGETSLSFYWIIELGTWPKFDNDVDYYLAPFFPKKGSGNGGPYGSGGDEATCMV